MCCMARVHITFCLYPPIQEVFLPLEHLVVKLAELQAHEPSPWFQHPVCLVQYCVYVCHVSNAKSYCICCEWSIVDWKLFCVTVEPTNLLTAVTQLSGPQLAYIQHGFINVTHCHTSIQVSCCIQIFQEPECNVTWNKSVSMSKFNNGWTS